MPKLSQSPNRRRRAKAPAPGVGELFALAAMRGPDAASQAIPPSLAWSARPPTDHERQLVSDALRYVCDEIDRVRHELSPSPLSAAARILVVAQELVYSAGAFSPSSTPQPGIASVGWYDRAAIALRNLHHAYAATQAARTAHAITVAAPTITHTHTRKKR